MIFDVITLFPQMFDALTQYGITRRAAERGNYVLRTWNPRDFTTDNYRTIDDRPYGGGPGMVMLAEPLAAALAMRIGRVHSTLCGHATASQATALGSSEERIAAVMKAIAWTRSIRASDLQDNSKSDLLSHRAKETCEAIGAAAGEWRDIHVAREEALSRLTEFGAQGICQLPPDDLVRLINDLSTRSHELAEFIPLRRLRRQLDANGLSEFLAACDRQSVEPGRIPVLFEAIVAERRAAAARRAEGLSANNGALLEARRRAFAERDRAKIVTDRAAVRAKLLQATPPVGAQDGPRKTWTEMRLLGNEFSKVQRALLRSGSFLPEPGERSRR